MYHVDAQVCSSLPKMKPPEGSDIKAQYANNVSDHLISSRPANSSQSQSTWSSTLSPTRLPTVPRYSFPQHKSSLTPTPAPSGHRQALDLGLSEAPQTSTPSRFPSIPPPSVRTSHPRIVLGICLSLDPGSKRFLHQHPRLRHTSDDHACR
jgi:hypothetical protein